MTPLNWLPRRSNLLLSIVLVAGALLAVGWGLTRDPGGLRTEDGGLSTGSGTQSSALSPQSSIDFPGTAIDVTLKLIVVLVLAYGALALLQRYSLGLGHRRGALEVIESTTLAPNRALYVVRVGADHLLIGVTASRISVLDRWASGNLPEGFSGGPDTAEAPPRAD